MEDVEAALAEAAEVGVTRLISMGTDAATCEAALGLATRHQQVFAGAGHHPVNSEPPDLDRIRELSRHPRVVAIGEVGLDYVHPEHAPEHLQREWFDALCGLAEESALPVSVHSRRSEHAVFDVLAAHPRLQGVMHYFALDWSWAERFLDLGLLLGLSGLVTRPRQADLREVARQCPADRLLLETDTPFGTPHRRLSPNRPAWLLDTARLVAELRGVSLEELAAQTTANARALFTRLS